MIVALAYSYPEQDRVEKLLALVRTLGPYPGHTLILGVEKRVTKRFMADTIGSFNDVIEFDFVDLLEHFPESKNLAFQQCQLFIQQLVGGQPGELFLYLESDAVPLVRGWLDAIQQEAVAGGKPFTGAFVPAVPTHRSPAHMGAVGVYPVNMIAAGAGDAMIATEQPWPAAIAKVVTTNMFVSKLIADDWEGTGVPERCALYHPDRDGKILQSLSVGIAPSEASRGDDKALEGALSDSSDSGQLKEGSEVAERTSGDDVAKASLSEASSGVGLSPEDHAGSNPAPPASFFSDPENWKPGVFPEGLGKTHPEPWENRLQSEETIKFLALELKKFCTKPAYIAYVRAVLKKAKVIGNVPPKHYKRAKGRNIKLEGVDNTTRRAINTKLHGEEKIRGRKRKEGDAPLG